MCEFHESTCNGFGDIWWTDNPIYFSSIDDQCNRRLTWSVPRESEFNQSETASGKCARVVVKLYGAQLYKGSIFVITKAQLWIQSQVNCTESLHVDATIMRSFQTEQYSRFLPSPYAGHVKLATAKHCKLYCKVVQWDIL